MELSEKSENNLIGGIHLRIEANLLSIFIGAKTPWLSKIYTYSQQQKKERIIVNSSGKKPTQES